jgi:hypothetical protein
MDASTRAASTRYRHRLALIVGHNATRQVASARFGYFPQLLGNVRARDSRMLLDLQMPDQCLETQ